VSRQEKILSRHSKGGLFERAMGHARMLIVGGGGGGKMGGWVGDWILWLFQKEAGKKAAATRGVFSLERCSRPPFDGLKEVGGKLLRLGAPIDQHTEKKNIGGRELGPVAGGGLTIGPYERKEGVGEILYYRKRSRLLLGI